LTDVDFAQRWKLAHGPDATREVLCDAAHEMIRASGLDALNMRGLAARVGVSAMAPYKYYPAKDTLVEDVRCRVRCSFALCLKDAADAVSNPVDKLRRLCFAYLEYALGNEQDYRLIFATTGPTPSAPDAGALRAPAWEVLLNILHSAPDRDPEADPLDQAHLVWATLHGLVMLQFSNRLAFGRSVEDLTNSAARFMLNALRLS
jgi:AcrR family transcriptional regulator